MIDQGEHGFPGPIHGCFSKPGARGPDRGPEKEEGRGGEGPPPPRCVAGRLHSRLGPFRQTCRARRLADDAAWSRAAMADGLGLENHHQAPVAHCRMRAATSSRCRAAPEQVSELLELSTGARVLSSSPCMLPSSPASTGLANHGPCRRLSARRRPQRERPRRASPSGRSPPCEARWIAGHPRGPWPWSAPQRALHHLRASVAQCTCPRCLP